MSVTLTLTSCAIVAAVTLSNTAIAALAVSHKTQQKTNEGLETIFNDVHILEKTLSGFDCHYKVVSENEISVETTCGNLVYRRSSSDEAFRLYLNEITDLDGLIENIRSFEFDYGRNVQEYTYHHILDNLGEGMTVVNDEILDDDSLCLTINVE